MNNTDKLIINAAITGCVLTKKDSPYLPVTKQEITDCVRAVYEAGASIVHIHARNSDQTPCFDSAVYCELVDSVRQACPGMIICTSLSGRHNQNIEARVAALAAKPDLATLTLGSTNFPEQPNINAPDVICALTGHIYVAGAIPELEVFEPGFANYANFLIKKGALRPPFYFNLLMGSLGSIPLDLAGLGYIVSLLPPGAVWSVGGLGRYQLDANVMSIAAGGHVRVGLEDNLYFDRARTKLADNVGLVRRIAEIARAMGREPATPEEARQMIGLNHIHTRE